MTVKALGEFLSGFWAHLSILRLDYIYSTVFHRAKHRTGVRYTQLRSMARPGCTDVCAHIFLRKYKWRNNNMFRDLRINYYIQAVIMSSLISWDWCLGRGSSILPSLHTERPRRCGPALLARRSTDAPITRKSLTQDKSERFHLCRWVAPQSLVTGLRSPISTISFWQAAGGVTWHQLCTDGTWQARRSVMSASAGGWVGLQEGQLNKTHTCACTQNNS